MNRWELNFHNKKSKKVQWIHHYQIRLGCFLIFKIKKVCQLNRAELNKNQKKWKKKFYISIHKLLEINNVYLTFCLILRFLLLIN